MRTKPTGYDSDVKPTPQRVTVSIHPRGAKMRHECQKVAQTVNEKWRLEEPKGLALLARCYSHALASLALLTHE